jgi:type IV secretory pathway VirD2 relaxase
MSTSNDEKEFRLRPRKPRVPRNRNDGAVWAMAFKRILHYARTSRKGERASRARSFRTTRTYFQRCSVRISYSRNGTAGQWRAHGRYIERESATHGKEGKAGGFDASGHQVDVAAQLASWQTAGDQRLWKLIMSPEFGDRIDLERLTRDVLERMEKDTRTRLEWVAVTHHNTEHPHVHIALRGRTGDNQPLNLSREYVKHGIREVAESFCTRQLGPRTALDAADAERREVREKRFTSLDRIIIADAVYDNSAWFTVVRNPARHGLTEFARVREQHAAARLAFLETMRLAESVRPNTWRVRRDLPDVLLAMQRTSDRQKMLATHGVLMSDERLPIVMMDWDKTNFVEGRILVHGQDESSGRTYLTLEGTDARVRLIYYTPELEQARHKGCLRSNSLVGLRRIPEETGPRIEIEDFGDAEDLLRDPSFMAKRAQQLIRRGVMPSEDGWGGWLGRYQAQLRKAASELLRQAEQPEQTSRRRRERNRSRSRGR